MLADHVDFDQIALEQYNQGLHCLPGILLMIQKLKVNVQAFPLKGNLKNNTIQVSFGWGKMHAFFSGCPRSGKKSGKKIFFQGQGIVREF